MKVGIRKPSIKKSVRARTTGRVKRALKGSINPLYGKKGMGIVNDPKKAVYNKIYNKTTVGVRDIMENTTASSTATEQTAPSAPVATNIRAASQTKQPTGKYAALTDENLYKHQRATSVWGAIFIIIALFFALIAWPVGIIFAALAILLITQSRKYKRELQERAAVSTGQAIPKKSRALSIVGMASFALLFLGCAAIGANTSTPSVQKEVAETREIPTAEEPDEAGASTEELAQADASDTRAIESVESQSDAKNEQAPAKEGEARLEEEQKAEEERRAQEEAARIAEEEATRKAAEEAEAARVAQEREAVRIAEEQARADQEAETARMAAEEALQTGAQTAEAASVAPVVAHIHNTNRDLSLPPGTLVWLSATGSKFHSIDHCGSMNPNKARQVTIEEAAAKFEACENCW